jgi:hypothetical protein
VPWPTGARTRYAPAPPPGCLVPIPSGSTANTTSQTGGLARMAGGAGVEEWSRHGPHGTATTPRPLPCQPCVSWHPPWPAVCVGQDPASPVAASAMARAVPWRKVTRVHAARIPMTPPPPGPLLPRTFA